MRLSFLPRQFGTLLLTASALTAQGQPIPFAERFALAEDRQAALTELVPGSSEHYYYSVLLAQHEGRFDAAKTLIGQWVAQHGRSTATQRAQRRQLMLAPLPEGERFAALQRELGLRFNQQRSVPGARPDLPSALDPAKLTTRALDERALRKHPSTLAGFRPAAVSRLLAAGDVPDNLLRKALDTLANSRVQLPANLPELIVRALRMPSDPGFSRMKVASRLTLQHLEACARAMPELLGDDAFVGQWLSRLAPSADADRSDAAVANAWFERLEDFIQRLPRNQDSLRAHVLGNRLRFDLGRGVVDRDRLLAYVQLPRRADYVRIEYWREAQRAGTLVDLSRRYSSQWPAIGDDRSLLREALMQLLRTQTGSADFGRYLDADWLRRVVAETRIVYGDGTEDARWLASVDDAGWREQLRDRVEIRFVAGAERTVGIADGVALDVEVKNVDQLLVKVFEIDTYAYLRATGRMPDASLDLDGLVPGSEQRFDFETSPLRRTAQRIELPSIGASRGVWVVELIGGGTSSRAVIRKGALTAWQRPGAAGQEFRILDEQGAVLRDAHLELSGSVFRPDAQGVIVLPYSTAPGNRRIMLCRDGFASPFQFQHLAESYRLKAGAHVPREALVTGNRARLVVRPTLSLHGRRMPIGLLDEPQLVVTAVNSEGIESKQTVDLTDLQDGVEITHDFTVPPRLRRLSVQFLGSVEQLNRDEPLRLATDTSTFEVNGIDSTAQIHSAMLRRGADGYWLEVIGKDGEPAVGRAVMVQFLFREHTDRMTVRLATDARGRVMLGALEPVSRVFAPDREATGKGWSLSEALVSWPASVHALEGEEVRFPLPLGAGDADLAGLELFEIRGRMPLRDDTSKLSVRDGCIVATGLPAGDYQLTAFELPVTNKTVRLRVVAGQATDRALVGARRVLSRDRRSALRVLEGAFGDEAFTLRIAGHGPTSRVHVYASRYLPAFEPHAAFAPAITGIDWRLRLPMWQNDQLIGRRVGDEYRYVLERREAQKYPGNMLTRPGLILNPWAVDDADTGRAADARDGQGFGGPSMAAVPDAESSGGEAGGPAVRSAPGTWPTLDFLPEAARWVVSLRPDEDGKISVPLAALGSGQQLHVVVVDPGQHAYQQFVRGESELPPRTSTLAEALDPKVDHLQQRGIELVGAGQDVVIDDLRSADVQTYASLGEVFDLFVALGGAGDLPRFAFLKDWPQLDPSSKLARYDEFACHELHVFLHEKDPEFFTQVVRPFLANKLHKTFLDHWLLESDLTPWLEPWRFRQLNAVEQVLLAQRLPEQRRAVARLMREAAARSAQTAEDRSRLVRTALLADALDKAPAELAAGLKLRRLRSAGEKQYRGPGDAIPPGAGGGGGGRTPGPAGPSTPGPGGPSTGGPAGPATRAAANSDEFFMGGAERARESRRGVGRLYAAPDATRRYVEHNYWHLRIEQQTSGLITPDRFWADFAQTPADQPFSSAHLVEAADNFAEAVLALAFLDLPFAAPDQEPQVDGTRWQLRTAGPTLVVREEIAPAQRAAGAGSVLVSQNVYRLDEPSIVVNGVRRDRFLSGELLAGVAYGCRVVVTNPTSAPRRLELLVQVPSGALPVNGGFLTRGASLELQAYGTATYEYGYYFPRPGEAVHYPARVAESGAVVAVAAVERTSWPIVAELSEVDEESWDWVSQNAESENVLEWLSARDLQQVDLSRIAWRLRDSAFYEDLVGALELRRRFDPLVWSFAIHHRDAERTRQYLEIRNDFQGSCGPYLNAALLRIEPVSRRRYQHVEFAPLVNARAHPFAGERRILNGALSQQYREWLNILCYVPQLDSDDWLQVTYYLLLQDRIAEALDAFARVDAQQVATRLQYDYARAYLAFFTEDLDVARQLAERHADHPVARWRDRFRTVLAHLDEAAGVVASRTDETVARQRDPASTAPSLELEVDGQQVELRHGNLERVELNFYRMDVEFLFSTRPFAAQDQGGFAYVRPNRSERVVLDAAAGRTELTIPADLRDANLMVEVRGGGLVRNELRIASSLAVRWMDTQGQLQVASTDTGRPLSKVYVKVFAREPGGRVRFHKDGYTDLRGRFDYASLSGNGVMNVQRFAVLVLSEDRGAAIRELAPPAR